MKRLALAAITTLAACSPHPAPDQPPPPTTATPPPEPTAPTTAPTTAAPTTPPPQATTAPPSPRSAVDAPAGAGTEGMPGQDVTLEAIARCEGYPDHVNSDHPGESSASGKYGVLDSTWDGYGGYESAADAPEAVQDQWAAEAYARAGTRPWRASRSCWMGAA